MRRKGLLLVNTGKGKGKTTAALGVALRALGHGMRVCIIQFLKGRWKTGESRALRAFGGQVELHTLGRGFTWQSENLEEDTRIAREAWAFARGVLADGRYDLVILDELTHLVSLNMVDEADVLLALSARPAAMHVVITGRDASEGLVAAADLVTEMVVVKHPFDSGVKAQRGIEF